MYSATSDASQTRSSSNVESSISGQSPNSNTSNQKNELTEDEFSLHTYIHQLLIEFESIESRQINAKLNSLDSVLLSIQSNEFTSYLSPRSIKSNSSSSSNDYCNSIIHRITNNNISLGKKYQNCLSKIRCSRIQLDSNSFVKQIVKTVQLLMNENNNVQSVNKSSSSISNNQTNNNDNNNSNVNNTSSLIVKTDQNSNKKGKHIHNLSNSSSSHNEMTSHLQDEIEKKLQTSTTAHHSRQATQVDHLNDLNDPTNNESSPIKNEVQQRQIDANSPKSQISPTSPSPQLVIHNQLSPSSIQHSGTSKQDENSVISPTMKTPNFITDSNNNLSSSAYTFNQISPKTDDQSKLNLIDNHESQQNKQINSPHSNVTPTKIDINNNSLNDTNSPQNLNEQTTSNASNIQLNQQQQFERQFLALILVCCKFIHQSQKSPEALQTSSTHQLHVAAKEAAAVAQLKQLNVNNGTISTTASKRSSAIQHSSHPLPSSSINALSATRQSHAHGHTLSVQQSNATASKAQSIQNTPRGSTKINANVIADIKSTNNTTNNQSTEIPSTTVDRSIILFRQSYNMPIHTRTISLQILLMILEHFSDYLSLIGDNSGCSTNLMRYFICPSILLSFSRIDESLLQYSPILLFDSISHHHHLLSSSNDTVHRRNRSAQSMFALSTISSTNGGMTSQFAPMSSIGTAPISTMSSSASGNTVNSTLSSTHHHQQRSSSSITIPPSTIDLLLQIMTLLTSFQYAPQCTTEIGSILSDCMLTILESPSSCGFEHKRSIIDWFSNSLLSSAHRLAAIYAIYDNRKIQRNTQIQAREYRIIERLVAISCHILESKLPIAGSISINSSQIGPYSSLHYSTGEVNDAILLQRSALRLLTKLLQLEADWIRVPGLQQHQSSSSSVGSNNYHHPFNRQTTVPSVKSTIAASPELNYQVNSKQNQQIQRTMSSGALLHHSNQANNILSSPSQTKNNNNNNNQQLIDDQIITHQYSDAVHYLADSPQNSNNRNFALTSSPNTNLMASSFYSKSSNSQQSSRRSIINTSPTKTELLFIHSTNNQTNDNNHNHNSHPINSPLSSIASSPTTSTSTTLASQLNQLQLQQEAQSIASSSSLSSLVELPFTRYQSQRRLASHIGAALNAAQKTSIHAALEMLQTTVDSSLNHSPHQIASFLYTHSHAIDRRQIGDFLSSTDDKHRSHLEYESIRISYCSLCCDFVDSSFDIALRLYLCDCGFRLPGESQKIDRLLEAFCKQYVKDNPSIFRNYSAAFIVSFALVMLNTDLHDPRLIGNQSSQHNSYNNNNNLNYSNSTNFYNNTSTTSSYQQHTNSSHRSRPPMTMDQFVSNLRGVDDGADFDRSFLQELYRGIAAHAIEWKEPPGSNQILSPGGGTLSSMISDPLLLPAGQGASSGTQPCPINHVAVSNNSTSNQSHSNDFFPSTFNNQQSAHFEPSAASDEQRQFRSKQLDLIVRRAMVRLRHSSMHDQDPIISQIIWQTELFRRDESLQHQSRPTSSSSSHSTNSTLYCASLIHCIYDANWYQISQALSRASNTCMQRSSSTTSNSSSNNGSIIVGANNNSSSSSIVSLSSTASSLPLRSSSAVTQHAPHTYAPSSDVDTLHQCIDALAYGSCIGVLLAPQSTELQAFSRQLAKITYLADCERTEGTELNNEKNPSKDINSIVNSSSNNNSSSSSTLTASLLHSRILSGSHLQQQWYKALELLTANGHTSHACRTIHETVLRCKSVLHQERRVHVLRRIERDCGAELVLTMTADGGTAHNRTLVKCGPLYRLKSKQQSKKILYTFLLFNDMLVYASENTVGAKLKVHRVLLLSLCVLQDVRIPQIQSSAITSNTISQSRPSSGNKIMKTSNSGTSLSSQHLHVIRIISAQKTISVACRSADEKHEWLTLLTMCCRDNTAKRRHYIRVALGHAQLHSQESNAPNNINSLDKTDKNKDDDHQIVKGKHRKQASGSALLSSSGSRNLETNASTLTIATISFYDAALQSRLSQNNNNSGIPSSEITLIHSNDESIKIKKITSDNNMTTLMEMNRQAEKQLKDDQSSTATLASSNTKPFADIDSRLITNSNNNNNNNNAFSRAMTNRASLAKANWILGRPATASDERYNNNNNDNNTATSSIMNSQLKQNELERQDSIDSRRHSTSDQFSNKLISSQGIYALTTNNSGATSARNMTNDENINKIDSTTDDRLRFDRADTFNSNITILSTPSNNVASSDPSKHRTINNKTSHRNSSSKHLLSSESAAALSSIKNNKNDKSDNNSSNTKSSKPISTIINHKPLQSQLHCKLCMRLFGMFRRRFACRCCHETVCNECCMNKFRVTNNTNNNNSSTISNQQLNSNNNSDSNALTTTNDTKSSNKTNRSLTQQIVKRNSNSTSQDKYSTNRQESSKIESSNKSSTKPQQKVFVCDACYGVLTGIIRPDQPILQIVDK